MVAVGDANEDFDDNNHYDTSDDRLDVLKTVAVFMIAVPVVVVVVVEVVVIVGFVLVVVVVVMGVVMMK